MAKITTPDSLYGNSRDILREAERENEILADIAGEEYESPGDIPKGKYVIEKRLLDAAQKKNELLEAIAEEGGGGSGAAKAIGIDYATDIISLKNKDGDVISGSGATLPAYGVSFDPTTGGLTLTKNGTAVQGQTVTIPNYGSPVGVTDSADMVDEGTIYLYEGTTGSGFTNGHFYYYDGSAWADGGEYAAATVQTDKTLLVEDRAADAKATGEAVGELKTQLNTTNKIVALDFPIVLDTTSAGSGYISSNGTVGSNNDYNHTDFIDISNYSKIAYKRGAGTGTAVQYTAIYNDNKEFIRALRWGSNAESRGYIEELAIIDVADGEKFVRFTMFADTATYGDFYAEIAETALKKTLSEIDNKISKKINKTSKTGINLFNPETAVSGYIRQSGNISAGSSYITSEFIPIKNGQSIYVNRIRTFLAFDNNYNPISESYTDTTTNNYVYTATQDGYIRASLFTSYADSNIIAYGGKPAYYEPYNSETAVEPGVHLSYDMISDVMPYNGNVLDGKKWVACGDSFTHGDFQRSMTDDYTFTDSPYYGQNKVYPFWIGRRNQGLTVINEAISGSTMTAGDSGVNPFSGTRYTAIPADTDYITLMFGINDSGNSCPIGTIDDADNTTFYGAWNVVLEYFITNFPYAHIGIIVGPGMQSTQGKTYAEAEIAVAKKWGIPYLNIQFESGGENIPLMLRTSNPDVSATAKTLRNNQQYVNNIEGSLNMHPNEKAHEFESTFIEAWLRTL